MIRAGLAAAAFLAFTAAPAEALVFPGDTFTVDVSGFDSSGTTGFLLTPQLTVAFGTTQTFAAAGINGQNITVSSLESIGTTTTTDTFTISTPISFLTTDTVGGVTITQLQFDLGNANSGSNTVRFLTPIATFNSAGTALYGGIQSIALAPSTALSSDRLFMSATEGVNSGVTPISQFAVRSFSYSITYATAVPEPASWAMMIVGMGAVGSSFRRRKNKVTIQVACA